MSEVTDDVDGIPALVVDNGADTIKAGFAGKENPTAIFPTVYGGCRCAQCISLGYAPRI